MEEREEKKGERKEERKGEEMTENASLLSKVEIRFLISSIHACPSPPLHLHSVGMPDTSSAMVITEGKIS